MELESYISTLLKAASNDGPYWLYRWDGGGWYDDEEGSLSTQIRNRIVAMTGVPREFRGAIGLAVGEWRDLLTIILAFYLFGWEERATLQIVTADAGCILQTTFSGPVKAMFTDPRRLEVFTRVMEEARFRKV